MIAIYRDATGYPLQWAAVDFARSTYTTCPAETGGGEGGIGDDWSKGKRIERGAGGERGGGGTN